MLENNDKFTYAVTKVDLGWFVGRRIVVALAKCSCFLGVIQLHLFRNAVGLQQTTVSDSLKKTLNHSLTFLARLKLLNALAWDLSSQKSNTYFTAKSSVPEDLRQRPDNVLLTLTIKFRGIDTWLLGSVVPEGKSPV